MVRLILVLLAFAPLAASAQTPAPAFDVEGAEAVVTAGRLPAEANRTGRHVTVLTAADIARSPARSLDELLQFEAGILTTPRSGFGAQADLSVRGGTFNGVVVLIDGARFNDPMTGHFLSDFPVPLSEIARVEVLRGPDAAAWGPDALGGVVHVITHTGARHPREPQRALRAEASAGELATAMGEVAGRRLGQPVEWSAAFAGVRTDGEPVRDAVGAPVVGSEGPVRADLQRAAGTASVVFPAPSLGARLTVRGAADAREFGAAQFYTPFPSDTARESTTTLWAQARLASAEPGARTSWSAHLSGRRHTDRYTYFPGLDPNRHTSRRLTLTAEASRHVTNRFVLGAGVSAEARDITSNALGEHGDVSGGLFLLARWSPTGPLAVSASARLDADRGFGVEPTPMVSAAYAVSPALSVRAAAGRAVRAPTYVERYFNTVAPRPGGNLGNPELRAERAWNAEAGMDFAPVRGLALQATGFWRRTGDLIDYVRTTVAGEEVFLAQNVLGAEAAGVETSVSVLRRVGPGHILRLSGGYTYTDVRIDAGAFAEGDFKYVLDHAPHLAQARAALDAGRVRLAVEGMHKARIAPAEGFTVVNARLGAVVGPDVSPVEGYVEVRNALNERYTEVFGAPMPRRLWMAGVRVWFER